MALGCVQTNMVILPRSLAFEFMVFCQRNPKPCPVIEVLEAGQTEAALTAPGSDVRTDLPRYRVYEEGRLVNECGDLLDLWRDDFVTFLLGCSFSFERALVQAGITLSYLSAAGEESCGQGANVPMFKTAIETVPAGPFSGPLVVSQRWIRGDQVVRAVQVTSRFPGVHGAPVQIGESAKLGIADPYQPDYGNPWMADTHDHVPVYWACGVTPQAVALASRLPFMITHAPGCMFVTDLKDEDMAVF
jgi:uncharacterized protein YcsI (UPF0317 family)